VARNGRRLIIKSIALKISKWVVIIVNWNGKKWLRRCLRSLRGQTDQDFTVLVVDNGSQDDSLELLEKDFPETEVISLPENTGFARANNIAISQALEAGAEHLILLNNDTEVPAETICSLKKLVKKKEIKVLSPREGCHPTKWLERGKSLSWQRIKTSQVAAWAPKILLMSDKKEQQQEKKIIDAVGTYVLPDGRCGNRGHGERDKGQYGKPEEVFGFCGGAALLSGTALRAVAGEAKTQKTLSGEIITYRTYFDDLFFAYYEDADLSWRWRSAGWRIVSVPEVEIYHRHSVTADNLQSSTFKAYYLNRNRFLFILKNFPLAFLKRAGRLLPTSYRRSSGSAATDSRNRANMSRKSRNWRRKLIMIGVLFKVLLSLIFHWRHWYRARRKSFKDSRRRS